MAEQLGFDFFELEPKQPELTDVWHKPCKTCKTSYPETEQYFNRAYVKITDTKEEKVYYHSTCRTCQNKSDRDRRKLRATVPPSKGVCDCCGKLESETKTPLNLDHDHNTGEFRGWICEQCNRGIGNLGDDIEGVLMALEYLKRHYEKD